MGAERDAAAVVVIREIGRRGRFARTLPFISVPLFEKADRDRPTDLALPKYASVRERRMMPDRDGGREGGPTACL